MMFDFLLADGNIVFTAALVLMLLVGVIQALGLGDFADGLDMDADVDGDIADASADGLLALLGFGRLPLMMLLVIFLALFGIIGISGQQFWQALTGSMLTSWLAAPVAAIVAAPLTGAVARPLARIMPHDETTAINIDSLIGRFGQIQLGQAQTASPARARVRDQFGLDHYVMVEPDNAGQILNEGEEIILVRREGDVFKAISRGNNSLPRLD